MYYDRVDVSSLNFLLRMDVGKAKDAKGKEKAKFALKELEKISLHCEAVKCRHQFFTDFFGDEKPNCKDMCDACKNKKLCEKNVDSFMQMSSSANLGGYNKMPDLDPEDLYEGGRSGNLDKESFETYDNETNGSENGFRKASELEKNSNRAVIDKQFALRKASAAVAMEMLPTAQMTRIKSAQSTETKVVGLTIKIRDQNLGHLADLLKKNMEDNAQQDKHPLHKLKYKDLEEIAKNIEYDDCFSTCKAISIYRRNVVMAIKAIKSCDGLHPSMINHVPSTRQPLGGDAKTIINNLKERYGSDVIDDLESEKSKKTERVKKNKLQQSGRDGLNQTRINSFFSTTPKKSPDEQKSPTDGNMSVEIVESSDSSSDSELIKLELKKKALQDELNQTTEDMETRDTELSKSSSRVYDVDEENEGQLVIDEGPIDKGDGFAIESMKWKNESSVQPESLNLVKRPRHNEIPSAPPAKPSLEVKRVISDIVVHQLTPFYKSRKIFSSDSKSLFKAVARKMTHYFLEKWPNTVPPKDIIKSSIHKLFVRKGRITELDDITFD